MNKSIVFIIILIISLGLLFTLNSEDQSLEVHFLNVGQGDAILIRTPDQQNILIDGGEDNRLLSEIADVLPWWERTIDYVVITHYHADHLMGLMELLHKYKVKEVLVTNHQPDDFLYHTWLNASEDYNLEPTLVQAGEKFVLSDDLLFQILIADDYHEDYNDNSLVLRLSYKNIDYLFMGDLSTEGEAKLLNSDLILESEILKVGHHGSKYSSSLEFLQAVKPELCIIQSGQDNKFGHPHAVALSRLEAAGCNIRNTQSHGRISTFTNGLVVDTQ